MNVTNKENKYRQLHNNGGYRQKVSAEQRGYAEAYASSRITENNLVNADSSTEQLMEKILDRRNLNDAYKKVRSNKGAGGIDGMGVEHLLQYLRENKEYLIQSIREGKYRPNPVRRVEIPKEERGKVRMLGIPTVVDRVIQQAMAQVLSPLFEEQFSNNSFGFRPNRSAHQAMEVCVANANTGYKHVIDMDLEKYFDTVNQSKLIEVLSRTIKDGRVISLIHKYLNAGVIVNHTFKETKIGVPQGGPLSPLLSNIMLNELDQELERRGHKFVRYADDMMIFCRSRKSANRTLKNILPFIEKKLFLKVNTEKTVVDYVGKVKFLGFSLYSNKGGFRLRVSPKAVNKMKVKVKELTSRNNGWSNEYRIKKLRQYVQGWVNYFRIADIKHLVRTIDKWMRRRVRMIYWKQWKRVRTRVKMLRHLGIEKWKALQFANTRKGYWRISNSPILTLSLDNKMLSKEGFLFFSEYYERVRIN